MWVIARLYASQRVRVVGGQPPQGPAAIPPNYAGWHLTVVAVPL